MRIDWSSGSCILIIRIDWSSGNCMLVVQDERIDWLHKMRELTGRARIAFLLHRIQDFTFSFRRSKHKASKNPGFREPAGGSPSQYVLRQFSIAEEQ